MSSLGYDDALLSKIKNWIKDDSLRVVSPDEVRKLFEMNIDTNDDKPIKLPLIVLRRLSPIRILNVSKRPLTFDGYRDSINSKKGNQLNAIPIQIDYQIDIYTRYLEESDEYLRNFVFNIINYPRLEIEIPYNDSKLTAYANIRLNPDLEDNSDIPERLVQGQFTRRTISIYIDDAYLFDYRTKDTIKIGDIDVDIKLKSDVDY